eukprot:TRINITY_DN2718_c0_g1_i2.p1 TRINITY_DN2718_c0_g1~~TRINITY_DN2718_c0_g1_i2.p1  ORF type:complete len:147 (-),score=37.94 TRINITY_DN2718_c0_g1_i2:44-484(-)
MFTASRTTGPAYYVLFMLILVFILINMFVAILSDAFAMVEFNTSDSLWVMFKRFYAGKKRKILSSFGIHQFDQPIPGAKGLLMLLKKARNRWIYVRNYSGISKTQLRQSMGFKDMPFNVFESVWSILKVDPLLESDQTEDEEKKNQ